MEESAAQPGDVVVRGGHAGIYLGTDAQGHVWGCANNGTPHNNKGKNYHDGNTGKTDFSPKDKVDDDGNKVTVSSRFFRPLAE
jgi:hypothetical protein